MPAIVVLNVVVLMPVAMAALYGIGARIGGRVFGYWCLLLWVIVPFLGVLYTNTGYHQRYTELTLPQGFGLTAMSDFPTMVAVIVSPSRLALPPECAEPPRRATRPPAMGRSRPGRRTPDGVSV